MRGPAEATPRPHPPLRAPAACIKDGTGSGKLRHPLAGPRESGPCHTRGRQSHVRGPPGRLHTRALPANPDPPLPPPLVSAAVAVSARAAPQTAHLEVAEPTHDLRSPTCPTPSSCPTGSK